MPHARAAPDPRRKALASRAYTPLYTYDITTTEGETLTLTRGFAITAPALVMTVAGATIGYIIMRAAIG